MELEKLLTPKEIIYSKRKSISLVIDAKGDFFVRAPLKCPMYKILDFIKTKSRWIISKSILIKSSIKYPPIKFVSGEKMPIFDEECIIEISPITRTRKVGHVLYIPNTESNKKLKSYLKRELKKYILSRIDYYADLMQQNYASISISSARTNWGSCSGANKLHFTFYLSMCRSFVVDYIIVHELCHIKYKNHSDKYWAMVENYYPNYKNAEKWLKNNRYIMDIIT